LARTAVLLHVLGHGLVKASMFVLAGRILTATGSSRIADVRNLLADRPALAAPFLAGTAALLGFPPFVLFFTEVAIVLAGWQRGLGWAMAVALTLLLVIFAGFGRHVLAMTLHGPQTEPEPPPSGRGTQPAVAGSRAAQLPILLALGASAVLPVAAWPLARVLTDAAAALGGRR
jgi:hydrogenase-4 component F